MQTLKSPSRLAAAAILVFSALRPGVSLSRDASSAKVDALIEGEMQKQHIPGVALAVVENGHVILAKGYGLANVEHQVAVKPETVFQSGSVGKQFTATAVMMLVEE